MIKSIFFEITQYNSDTHNARKILPLWASSKTGPANLRDWWNHHKRLAVDGNYYWMHNAVKSQNIRSNGSHEPKTSGATEALVIIRLQAISLIKSVFWSGTLAIPLF